jgi:hypothetical protein
MAANVSPNNAGPPHEAKRNKAGLSDHNYSFTLILPSSYHNEGATLLGVLGEDWLLILSRRRLLLLLRGT